MREHEGPSSRLRPDRCWLGAGSAHCSMGPIDDLKPLTHDAASIAARHAQLERQVTATTCRIAAPCVSRRDCRSCRLAGTPVIKCLAGVLKFVLRHHVPFASKFLQAWHPHEMIDARHEQFDEVHDALHPSFTFAWSCHGASERRRQVVIEQKVTQSRVGARTLPPHGRPQVSPDTAARRAGRCCLRP